MRRVLANPRLTVHDKQVVLEMAAAGASTADMAAAVGAHAATIWRLLAKAGVSRPHGGARAEAGQTGKGSETAAERIELTPEMVWVDALARLYGLGMSKQQYSALVRAFPALKGKRKSPQERLALLHGALEDFYPRLAGKKVGSHDLGVEVLQMFNSSYQAIKSEMPVPPPLDDETTLAAFEEQVAVGEMGRGARRVVSRTVREEDEEVGGGPVVPAAFWPVGAQPPPETPVTAAPHARSKKFKELREQRARQKEAGTLEALEREAGVIRIDPARYLEEQALRAQLEAMRAEGRIETMPSPRHLVVPPPRPRRNPDASRDDAASTALAMLRLSGSVMPTRKPQTKKKKAPRAKTSAAFRRMMRI